MTEGDESRTDSEQPPDEVQALAEAVLEGARVAGLGVMVSFDDGGAARHIYVNDAVAAILGRSAEALLGQDALSLFAPAERSGMTSTLARWRDGVEAPGPVETTMVRADGELVPVELSASVVPLGGEPAMVLFVRDIRERRQAEATLRRSERRFRRLIEAAPDAIGVSREARFIYVNPALAALSGRTAEELAGRDVSEVVHADDRELVLASYRARERGELPSRPLEYRLLRPDGGVVHVETSSLLLDYEGAPALLEFSRDTTARTLLQTRLVLRDRMATLGQLSASVAHEINNPLAYATLNVEALIGQLRRLSGGALSEELEGAVAAARDGLARVATIVRDLRELCASNTSTRWPVDARDVIESALTLAGQAVAPRAQVERLFDDEVPPLETDPTKLGQILLNLILNASESFPDADPARQRITIGLHRPRADEVLITVADNGPGIRRQDLERIFEPFFTTKEGGMGLGLAICQTLAASLRGSLRVESVLGQGTTFQLRLPAPGDGRNDPADPNGDSE